MTGKYNSSSSCYFTDRVDKDETVAFFGLLYLAGVFESNNEDLQSLSATDGTGRDISLKHFYFFAICKLTTRERTRGGDPMARIFEICISKCKSNYSCGEYLAIDEMLILFCRKCT